MGSGFYGNNPSNHVGGMSNKVRPKPASHYSAHWQCVKTGDTYPWKQLEARGG